MRRGVGRGEGVSPPWEESEAPPQKIETNSERNSTLDGMLLNARSSNANVNKAVETNSKCTQFFIDFKILY